MGLSACEDCGFPFSERASACPKCAGPRIPVHSTSSQSTASATDDRMGLSNGDGEASQTGDASRPRTSEGNRAQSSEESLSPTVGVSAASEQSEGSGSGALGSESLRGSDTSPNAETAVKILGLTPPAAGEVEATVFPPGVGPGGKTGSVEALSPGYDLDTSSASLPETPPHPWRRYWAKMTDTSVFVVLFIVVGTAFFPQLWADENPAAVISVLVMALFVVWDAILLWAFHTTPGRWLAGARLFSEVDKELRLPRLLKRNALLYVKGLALGISIFALFTAANGYSKVSKGRAVSWDIATNTNYSFLRLSLIRWCFLVGIPVFFILLSAWASVDLGAL